MQVPANPNATAATVALLKNLDSNRARYNVFGHQDSLAYGNGWRYHSHNIGQRLSDVKDTCGDYPGLFGWDIGQIKAGRNYLINGIIIDELEGFVKQVHNMGCINTFTWHADNPVTGRNAWDRSEPATVQKLLTTAAYRRMLTDELDLIAAFFNKLKDNSGQPIPIIFRPFHESTNHGGGSFWWGKDCCRDDEFKRLWYFVYDYLVNRNGLNQLLFCYSVGDYFNEIEFMNRYPGDAFVDIIGFSAYQRPNDDTVFSFGSRLKNQCRILEQLSNNLGKLPALAETGANNLKDNNNLDMKDWWTKVLYPAIKDSPLAYTLVWRNPDQINDQTEFYCSYPGHPTEEDFKAFYRLKKIIFQKTTKKLKIFGQ